VHLLADLGLAARTGDYLAKIGITNRDIGP